ncbi:MAG: ECF transporter S component [Oscillospiraceae bacterium]|nr:ECF transporter S component [Oscillospiraceae bacterium]
MPKTTARLPLKSIVLTALFAAISSVLFLVQFGTPLTPDFLKLDLSDLPALLAAMTLGTPYGVLVCLLKNLIGLLHSSTFGIGELSNLLLSTTFVTVAGLVYRKASTRKGAVLATLLGAAAMAAVSLPSNLFLIYPLYVSVMNLPLPVILGWYQEILPSARELWQALLIFNVPFTFVKAMMSVVIVLMIYRPLKPFLTESGRG